VYSETKVGGDRKSKKIKMRNPHFEKADTSAKTGKAID
jgi:hypothetical protein